MDGSSTVRIRRFGEFRRSVVDSLEQQLAAIERAMEDVRAHPGDASRLAEAVRRLEDLFGLGGAMGMAQVCRAASLFRSTLPASAEAPAPLDGMVRAFLPSEASPLRRTPSMDLRRLYVLAADGAEAAALAGALRRYSYDVVPFASPEDLDRALEAGLPLAVLASPERAPESVLARLRSLGLPFFFLSTRDDLNARIAAVRAGARGFFTGPEDAAALADGLDRLMLERSTEPYRVLIVDDDPMAAALHAEALRRVGLRVSTVTEPSRALEALLDSDPDLLLLDMDLGPFSGDEVAAAVRQHPSCVGLPIVFISSEARPTFQVAARGAGGDSFLVKPVSPERLRTEVLLRAEQGRAMRSHLQLDGPTGALNPTSFLGRLRNEIDLGRRHGRGLCCARAEIDGFRALQDGRGDLALRRLRTYLRRRLRRTDILGRTGAGAFTVVLLDADAKDGVRTLDEIRAALEADAVGTLSAGVADFPTLPEAGLLLDAVHRAQLRASAEGGNRVLAAR